MQVLRERRAAKIGPLAAVAELLEDVARGVLQPKRANFLDLS